MLNVCRPYCLVMEATQWKLLDITDFLYWLFYKFLYKHYNIPNRHSHRNIVLQPKTKWNVSDTIRLKQHLNTPCQILYHRNVVVFFSISLKFSLRLYFERRPSSVISCSRECLKEVTDLDCHVCQVCILLQNDAISPSLFIHFKYVSPALWHEIKCVVIHSQVTTIKWRWG